jgi:mono/diheme cytochrome c family protein
MKPVAISHAALLAIALSMLALLPAIAEEKAVPLKDAPGREAVEAGCGICHSLDYIPMNAAFQKPDTWKAEVTKMVNAFGAEITPADQEKILEYLIANYGVKG